jgi:proliferating cell nuclear antigen
LVALSESVTIEVTKGAIKFSCQGDIGNGQVTLKPYDDPEKPENNVSIELSSGVTLSFSLKYLVNFTKATPLSGSVTLRLLEAMPILVEYNMEGVGHLQYVYAMTRADLVSSLRQNRQMRIKDQL